MRDVRVTIRAHGVISCRPATHIRTTGAIPDTGHDPSSTRAPSVELNPAEPDRWRRFATRHGENGS